MPTSVTRLATVFLATCLLVACGAPGAQKSPQSASASEAGHSSEGSPETGSAALGFAKVMAATTIEGNALPRDARPIAMVFFASWCGHCRRELADLDSLRQTYPDLRIIGLNAYEDFRDFSDRERLRGYLESNAPWLTEIVSADEAMRAHFGKVPRIPTLFLYSAEGEVIAEFRRDKGLRPAAMNSSGPSPRPSPLARWPV